ncbi:MAG: hypothetical protein IPN88_17720 [Bacteroidetes bacterium]|nr:hypothetical protein [Bacteroidota bacterium]
MIHRLTQSIIAAVQKILPSMNIWGSKRDLTKQDVNIRLCEASKIIDEAKYIYQESQKGVKVGETSAILLPKHDMILKFANQVLTANNKSTWIETKTRWDKTDYEDLNRHFRVNGIKIQFIGNKFGSSRMLNLIKK